MAHFHTKMLTKEQFKLGAQKWITDCKSVNEYNEICTWEWIPICSKVYLDCLCEHP